MKLQSNTSYGKELTEKYLKGFYNLTDYQKLRSNYDEFLSLPLTLGMFIPTDENGNVLEEKMIFADIDKDYVFESAMFDIYQQAKDRVIFEGFELIEISKNLRMVKNQNKDCQVFANQVQNIYYKCIGFETIEDLVKYNLTITEKAVKKY